MNRFTLQSKKNISRGATALLVFLLFALFAFSFYAELIPVNDGAGFDGAFYREVFRNFSTDFFTSGYDSFRIQRIFPFCLLNVVYGLAGIPLDNAHMIAGMYVLHFVNLALGFKSYLCIFERGKRSRNRRLGLCRKLVNHCKFVIGELLVRYCFQNALGELVWTCC